MLCRHFYNLCTLLKEQQEQRYPSPTKSWAAAEKREILHPPPFVLFFVLFFWLLRRLEKYQEESLNSQRQLMNFDSVDACMGEVPWILFHTSLLVVLAANANYHSSPGPLGRCTLKLISLLVDFRNLPYRSLSIISLRHKPETTLLCHPHVLAAAETDKPQWDYAIARRYKPWR